MSLVCLHYKMAFEPKMEAGWFHVTALAILINVFTPGILATGHTFTTITVNSLGLVNYLPESL